MLISILLATALGSAPVEATAEPPPSPPPVQSIDRARANYEAILRGEKGLFNLSPIEQDEVRQLDRRIRAQQPPDYRTPFDRCVDAEYAKLGREPAALDQRAIDMRCR